MDREVLGTGGRRVELARMARAHARAAAPVKRFTPNQPTEQLLLTKDHTDYCWYSTTLNM